MCSRRGATALQDAVAQAPYGRPFTDASPLAEPLALALDEVTEPEPFADAEPFTETLGFPTRWTAPLARLTPL